MVNKVVKGRKYILAGNFLPEYKEKVTENLQNELGIEIVAIVTSENTEFIEYKDESILSKWFS